MEMKRNKNKNMIFKKTGYLFFNITALFFNIIQYNNLISIFLFYYFIYIISVIRFSYLLYSFDLLCKIYLMCKS